MHHDPEQARQRLRNDVLAGRDAMPIGDRQRFSALIAEAFIRHPQVAAARRIFLYCSFRSEVETQLLLHRCLQAGKAVSVPLTVFEQNRLVPVAITDPEVDLAPGYLGIPEPKPSVAEQGRIAPASIEVAVLPGSVFDRAGNRLGYGGGYYDRFLALEAPQAIRIGLGFSLQLVERLPSQAHDMPLDLLITEREILTWRS